MDPYRSAGREAIVEAPRDAGIVGDVIAQFADPLAFYRELVQNSIDAGSPSVELALVYDDAEGLLRAAVRDRGEGMTQDVVENNLLVLFRSTKERDDTKIGKFGIGFKSVLAPGPRLVVITTARDGKRLVVHLRPDLSYAVFDGGPATAAGTTVELELTMAPAEVAGFVARTREALARWCRHASVPLQLTARGPGGAALADERIDRPLALDGVLVEARASFDDDQLTVIVGVPLPGAPPYAGFFNHGLTLYETTEALAGPLAFKVQDRRLGHTLSRDNVRRDAAFDRAIACVKTVAAQHLPRVAAAAVRDAATDPDRARWRALVDAITAAGVALSARDWTVPLLEPRGTDRAIGGHQLGSPVWGATARTALTAALAAGGEPVVDLGEGAGAVVWSLRRIEELTGRPVRDVATEWTRIAPIDATPDDRRLCDAVAALLDAAHRRPSEIVLAELTGAHADAFAIAGGRERGRHDAGDGAWLIARDHAERSPFERIARGPLVLHASHPRVAAARARARDGGDAGRMHAAALLARAVLVRYGRLDADASAELLGQTLVALDVVEAP